MSYEKISDFGNLLQAGESVCKGGRWKPSVQSFELTLLRNTAVNKRSLDERSYKPHQTNNFKLKERGKWRNIKAHKIQDRQVYKSFCKHELKPSTANLILESNSASQKGKGTQHSIKLFRQGLAKATRKWGNDFYVITFDFHDYFGSIQHDKVLEHIHLTDDDSMRLLEQYVNIFSTDKGIGIGGEPSQDISVVYPSKIDRMLACEPCVISSGRYMDDGNAICHTKEEAKYVLAKIKKIANEQGLELNPKRTKISWMKRDSVVWLKKRTFITNTGRIVMRLARENIRDELRRISFQKEMVDSGRMPRQIADISIECWCSYAGNYNSRRAVLRVIKYYMRLFDVPWDKAKILIRKHHKGWRKINQNKGGNKQ